MAQNGQGSAEEPAEEPAVTEGEKARAQGPPEPTAASTREKRQRKPVEAYKPPEVEKHEFVIKEVPF